MTFSLEKQKSTLTNWNSRSELHGEEKVPASDLHIAFKANSDVLSEFDPALRSALYRAPHAGEGDMADQALAAENPNDLTKLRFPKMKNAIKWEHKIVGATVTVGYGTGGKSDIVMGDCTADGFIFEPMDGGTVIIKLRIQCHPDSKQAGKLYELNGNEIDISIAPPEADQRELMKDAA